MTTAPLVLAAALMAWGSVVPAPAPEPPAGAEEPAGANEEAATPAAAETPAGQSPAPSAASAAAPAPVIQPAILAKAPIVVRAAPAPVPTPAPATERGKLQSRWWFWAIAGGLFASAIVVTIVETRPGPQPYGGNTPPYTISFP